MGEYIRRSNKLACRETEGGCHEIRGVGRRRDAFRRGGNGRGNRRERSGPVSPRRILDPGSPFFTLSYLHRLRTDGFV